MRLLAHLTGQMFFSKNFFQFVETSIFAVFLVYFLETS